MLGEDKKTICYVIYAVYAVSVFLQFSFELAVLSSVAVIIAVIAASFLRKKHTDSYLESHYRWQIRTFWIGGAVYLPIVTIIAAIGMAVVAIPAVQKMIEAGETDSAKLEMQFMATHGQELMVIGLGLMLPFVVWWVYRCLKGVHYLRLGRPVPKPESWL